MNLWASISVQVRLLDSWVWIWAESYIISKSISESLSIYKCTSASFGQLSLNLASYIYKWVFWLWNFALEFACLWNLWKYCHCVVFSTRAELVRIGIFEIVILRLQLFEAPVNYDFEIPGLLCGVRGGLDWIPLSCQVGARSPWFFFFIKFFESPLLLALSFQICWAPAKLSLNLNLL